MVILQDHEGKGERNGKQYGEKAEALASASWREIGGEVLQTPTCNIGSAVMR